VLADYHNDEANIAWPSQDTLAADCEMPKRTVQWCLAVLEKQGFITTLRKGNQYKTSMYRLNFNVLTPLNDEGGESEGVSLAPSNEDAKSADMKAQDGASEGAMARHSNPQEPRIESTVPPFSE
jgi:hypothetical protein